MTQHDEIVAQLRAPGYLLRRAQQVHTEAWSRLVDGVTGPQYAVLVAAAGWPGHDQKRIGELASLDKSTAAGIVARLVAGEWLEQVPDPGDRRRRLLRLSPKALTWLPELTAGAAAVQRQLLDPLQLHEHDPFVDALAKVARIDEAGIGDQPPDERVLLMARTPGYLLRRAQQLHTALWREHVADITGPQYAVLAATITAGVATHSEIGERASLDSSSTRDIVGRLIEAGWLEPVAGAADRRSRPVRATTPATIAVRSLGGPVRSVQTKLLTPLEQETAERFLDWMELVAGV